MPLYELNGVAPDLPAPDRFWAAPDAALIGKVKLEADASVWFGAVLRGDNELIHIGEASNIQDHCVLHTDMGFPLRMGPGCTVGHRAVLHGCEIEANCLIGIGAIVLNGARVGANSLIGAGSVLPEGRTIPPNSLVMGVPGRIIRELTPDEIAGIARSAQGYVANWRRFASGLEKDSDSGRLRS
jgi:carbonic anhydrase/acetyltransferase-like protein (isoleucine patch superfamily)